jgi:transposase InsO family protein
VLDLFSRFIVGWALSAVNGRHLTIKALDIALKRRCPAIGLLHHSDQSCAYASEDCQALYSLDCQQAIRRARYSLPLLPMTNSVVSPTQR